MEKEERDLKLRRELWERDTALALRQGAGMFAKSVGYFAPSDPQKGVIVSLPGRDIFKVVPVEEIEVDGVKRTASYQGVELPAWSTKLSKNWRVLTGLN